MTKHIFILQNVFKTSSSLLNKSTLKFNHTYNYNTSNIRFIQDRSDGSNTNLMDEIGAITRSLLRDDKAPETEIESLKISKDAEAIIGLVGEDERLTLEGKPNLKNHARANRIN